MNAVLLGQSEPWLYGSWIYKYPCNQSLLQLTLWVRIPLRVRCTRYNIMWLATGRWFSPVSSTNKNDCHNINEILTVTLNTITLYRKSKLFFTRRKLPSWICIVIALWNNNPETRWILVCFHPTRSLTYDQHHARLITPHKSSCSSI